MNILMLDTRNVEQTKDVRMYTCRIYSSRDLDTLLYKLKVELNMHRKCSNLYTTQQWKRNVRIALRSQLTEEN